MGKFTRVHEHYVKFLVDNYVRRRTEREIKQFVRVIVRAMFS